MQDIVNLIKSMPEPGTTIQLYGKFVKVTGIKITDSAAYVTYDDGSQLQQDVNIANLKRLENEKEYFAEREKGRL